MRFSGLILGFRILDFGGLPEFKAKEGIWGISQGSMFLRLGLGLWPWDPSKQGLLLENPQTLNAKP